ncbi:MAG: DNA polymerase IV [Mollicutes bacterium]|nr:DNA polymerase IV [Mollicutes bacterium]MDY5875446.1 DNA polymerase IV [Bacilli bacterium]
MAERIIFHIDVNNAFLSWTAVQLLEEGYNIDIRTIPAIIAGDESKRHGIVLAKSPIAKKYGIVTAETIYQAKMKCPNLKIFSPNHEIYQRKSKQLMNYLKTFTPIMEQFSIDECFLDMTGTKYLYTNHLELAYKIKDEIKEKFGFTVNVGIGNNKLCAKMASDFEKPDKVHTLLKSEIKEKLWPLPVNDLFMCGKKTSIELNKMNIYTIKDLAEYDFQKLEKKFKSQAKYLKQAAWGIDESKVEERKDKRQSISTTRTLPHDEENKEKLKEVLFVQTEDVCRQLREQNLYASTIAIIYKDKYFKSTTVQEQLENATDNTKEILKKINSLFEKSYNNMPVRLIGVRLANLTKFKNTQVSIFDTEIDNDSKEESIQKTVDKINKKFGSSLIMPASIKKLKKNEEI